MESGRFDRLTRRVGSRRTFGLALGGAALLGLADAAAGRKTNKKGCKRQAIKICTGSNCGKQKNNCGKTYHCSCREGTTCLSDGSCA